MSRQKRTIMLNFRVTPGEKSVIEDKLKQLGTDSMSAFLRKMAMDGYVINLDLPELREMVSLLRRSSNSLNQIAKRLNSTSRIYAEDIAELKQQQQELWLCANRVLEQLAALN